MNCKDTRKAFVALLDGDLALTERAPIEVHLDRCIACWARLESLRSQPAPLRTVWRIRVALGSLDSLLDAIARLRRQMFSRLPSRVVPMAAAVTVMVVAATYGIQRWTEPAMAPEASPVRHTPASRIPPPLTSPEPASQSTLAPVAPLTEPAVASVTKPKAEPSRIPRDRPRPVAKAQVSSPDPVRPPVAAPAPTAEARPAPAWVLGNSKDEQNVLPESETVRRERD